MFNSANSVSSLYYCKLSSDQRSLIFDPYESDGGSIGSGSEDGRSGVDPIEVNKVEFTEMICTPEEDKKGKKILIAIGGSSCSKKCQSVLTF